MMCPTVLHGGVCHRTSTPHKSGNKMKEKKKVDIYLDFGASTRSMRAAGTDNSDCCVQHSSSLHIICVRFSWNV